MAASRQVTYSVFSNVNAGNCFNYLFIYTYTTAAISGKMKVYLRTNPWLLAFLLTLLSSSFTLSQIPNSVTWSQVKQDGKGTIRIYWHESKPFIFKAPDGQMSGIEPEIINGFKTYLKTYKNIDLSIEWIATEDFGSTLSMISKNGVPGSFASSAFSITPERLELVDFSPPYMADICVLITSNDIPIVKNTEEFNHVFSNLTAVTIAGTTYEQDLLQLKNNVQVGFKVKYIPSSENILRTIESMDHAFGLIDLPVYMMIFNSNPGVNVKRQNLFSTSREGYAFIFPKNTDWGEPLNEYFAHKSFQPNLDKIMAEYFNLELYRFIEHLAVESDDQVELLTREKEIQYKDLQLKLDQIEKDERSQQILIILLVVILSFMVVIAILYSKRKQQNAQIEIQRKNIELKSEQLEKRNHQLVTINEEKNHLIRILAHDLRTPISHVQGLTQVLMLGDEKLSADQTLIIQKISEASTRLNKMITSILDTDAIENDRVQLFIEDVAITPLTQQVVRSFEKQALKKNIEILFKADRDHLVKGESLFLVQVIENLLSNAIKFSPSDKSIDVNLRAVDRKVLISVKDQGPGLTQEDISLLFKKFQRLSAKPTGGESSTGLGLSIVKKYIELMGGRVWCESQVGKGATFTIELAMAE